MRPLLTAAYLLVPLTFVGINLFTKAADEISISRWPNFQAVLQPAGRISVARISVARIDIPLLKQSINRLPAEKLLRQTGNSLRIACGQRLSWCVWGNSQPAMLFHSVELWVSEGLNPASNQTILNGAITTIIKNHEILEHEGWKLVVVPVPTKLSIYRDHCDWPVLDKDLINLHPVETDQADEIYDRLISELQIAKISVLDLRAIYRTYRNAHPNDLLYPAGETHWSGLGLKLAADATADLVAQTAGIRRRQFTPSYLEVEEVADMAAAFDPLPQWTSRLTSIYKYRTHLVDGDEGKGFQYAQNPTSLLVLAGTSYSGQFTWHIGQPVGFAWALGTQLEECEFHNGAQAGHGSYAAFAQFLAERHTKEQDFATRRHLTDFPKVVVWEFPVRDLGSLVGQ